MAAIALLALLLQTQTPASPAGAATPPAIDARTQAQAQPDYVVGTQDVLSISMLGEADLTRTVAVDADGTFDYPYVGRVKAGGLTLRSIKTVIEKQLVQGGYFVAPQVTVEVAKYRSQNVFVLGEVRVPGQYALTGNMSILQVLAAAGSPTSTAAGYVVITRPVGVEPALPEPESAGGSSLRVSMNELQNGQLPEGFSLRDGDSINVPRAESVYVTGYVKAPGPYVIEGSLTVMQVIAMAGGPTERGATGRVKIFRRVGDKLEEVKNVRLSDMVKPGDTVHVPQRYF
ncbi:MAG: polysaccharide biosynthesis/export family protein [Vicinamibacterales bacterium]